MTYKLKQLYCQIHDVLFTTATKIIILDLLSYFHVFSTSYFKVFLSDIDRKAEKPHAYNTYKKYSGA